MHLDVSPQSATPDARSGRPLPTTVPMEHRAVDSATAVAAAAPALARAHAAPHGPPRNAALALTALFGVLLLIALAALPRGGTGSAVGTLADAASFPRAAAYLLCGLAGAIAGFFSGLLGIGGALIMMPALYLLLPGLGVATAAVPHVAVATSLLTIVPMSLVTAWMQHRRGCVDGAWLLRLGPGMCLGGAAGMLLAQELRGPVLALLFASQSLYYGAGLMQPAGTAPGRWRQRIARGSKAVPAALFAPATAAFCACAGMGAGSLVVPYLLIRGTRLLRAVGTASGLNFFLAAGAAGVLVAQGVGPAPSDAAGPAWPVALTMAAAATLTVHSGVALAHRMPVALFRRVLGAVTLLAAAVLIARTAWASA